MTQVRVVPDWMRETVEKPPTITDRLRAGETLFVPDGTNPLNRSYLKQRYGLRLITRRSVVDGERGRVVWAVPADG